MKRFVTCLLAAATLVPAMPASAAIVIDGGEVRTRALTGLGVYGGNTLDAEAIAGNTATASAYSVFNSWNGQEGRAETDSATTFELLSSLSGRMLFDSTTSVEIFEAGSYGSAYSQSSSRLDFYVSEASAFTFAALLSSSNSGGLSIDLVGPNGTYFSYSMTDFTGINPVANLVPGELYTFSVSQFGPPDHVGQYQVGIKTGFSADSVTFRLTPLAAPAVPEPATWGMMIAGFALVGTTMRRRTVVNAVRFA